MTHKGTTPELAAENLQKMIADLLKQAMEEGRKFRWVMKQMEDDSANSGYSISIEIDPKPGPHSLDASSNIEPFKGMHPGVRRTDGKIV